MKSIPVEILEEARDYADERTKAIGERQPVVIYKEQAADHGLDFMTKEAYQSNEYDEDDILWTVQPTMEKELVSGRLS